MSIRVVFLGTSGSVPTLKRSLPSLVVQCSREQWMFDCGENTQHQMMQAKISFHKKLKIMITHLHGDHVLGLPGLLQTMALMDRKEPVEVFGPVGIRNFLTCIKDILNFGLTFPVEIGEILHEGAIFRSNEYSIFAKKSNHPIESYVYSLEENPRPGKFYPKKAEALGVNAGESWSRLQRGESIDIGDGRIVKPRDVMGPMRSGRKIVYTGDTKPFVEFADFAKDADVIIHDCTFDDSLAERANVDGHSTPSQAASQALAARAKCLILSHISARYPEATLLLEQAKKIFPNTILAEDFLDLELPLGE
jgi:ribonuclease Z